MRNVIAEFMWNLASSNRFDDIVARELRVKQITWPEWAGKEWTQIESCSPCRRIEVIVINLVS